jgi:hypothetical protein
MKSKPDIKNGVRKPRIGSVNRRVWDISDEVYKTKEPKLRKVVLMKCADEGIGLSTASVEHCVWRRYTGLVNKRTKGTVI